MILNAAHNADYVASKLYFASEAVAGALSTGEWMILRPNTGLVLPRYIHYWLRAPGARKALKFLVKGIHLYERSRKEVQSDLDRLNPALRDRAAANRARAKRTT